MMSLSRPSLFTVLVVLTSLVVPSETFTTPLFGVGPSPRTGLHDPIIQSARFATVGNNEVVPSARANSLKETLLSRVKKFREIQQRDGDVAIDFGVKGGELNETSRAPQKVDYYAISQDLGKAADDVVQLCDDLSNVSPTEVPTQFWGDKKNGTLAPLHGTWRLLFTTAADASFTSKNSTRGTATVSNVIDATKGKLINVIQFNPKPDGTKPVADALNVVLEGKAAGDKRVSLRFRYVKVLLNKFFFFPLFGKRLRIYIPVPGPTITRLIVFASRIIKFGRNKNKDVKKPPEAYFDVIYLDKDLRIQRTGEDNIFVQAKESWDDAKPLLV